MEGIRFAVQLKYVIAVIGISNLDFYVQSNTGPLKTLSVFSLNLH
jgi:hypothetical protein